MFAPFVYHAGWHVYNSTRAFKCAIPVGAEIFLSSKRSNSWGAKLTNKTAKFYSRQKFPIRIFEAELAIKRQYTYSSWSKFQICEPRTSWREADGRVRRNLRRIRIVESRAGKENAVFDVKKQTEKGRYNIFTTQLVIIKCVGTLCRTYTYILLPLLGLLWQTEFHTNFTWDLFFLFQYTPRGNLNIKC